MDWEAEWIEMAKELVCEEFQRSYPAAKVNGTGDSDLEDIAANVIAQQANHKHKNVILILRMLPYANWFEDQYL